ncbi:MAG TPA: DNA polymerase Y family protein [Halioglobus sp.]
MPDTIEFIPAPCRGSINAGAVAMIHIGAALWLGLRFQRLALEIIEHGDKRPCAIVDQQRVYMSNAAIVEPGMSVATAHALVADLVTVTRQPEREQQAMDNLAHWAYQITPAVSVAEDNTLLLEIGSCQRLYGNLSLLLLRIEEALAQRGHCIAIGLAHTPKAAWLLAQFAPSPALKDGLHIDIETLQQQLATIPVAAIPIDVKIRTRLHNMGIETLGRLLSFDVALLGKRFGTECIRYLQQLTGYLPDPLPSLELAPQFDQTMAFIDGILNRQSLLFPMKRLLQTFSDYLVARQLNCRALQWRFRDTCSMCATMDIELSRSHHCWKSLLDLSQLKLDQIELPELVCSITLFADQFMPAEAMNFQLFEEVGANDGWHVLLDRLASRLGHDALLRVSTADSLWPESASRFIPLSEIPQQSLQPCGDRPAWLLPAPERLKERNNGLFWRAPLEILRGPERLESPPENGRVRHRDYYIAREKSGRLCWIYRELETGYWFVHGLFA